MTVSINIQSYLDNLTFLALFIAMLGYWTNISFTSLKVGAKIGFVSVCIANFAIFANLGSRWLENGYFPLSNLYESLMFFIWGITAITIVIEKSVAISLIGAVTSPLSLFVVAFATLSLPEGMQKASPLVPALKSNWLMMHVSIMMLSYAALLAGSLMAVVFLVLAREPKIVLVNEQKTEEKNSLVEVLDQLSYRTLGIGFPLLTLGILSGAVWANEAWGSYWSWDPKETWALITWFIFAIYLHLRISYGWEGKRPAVLASVGFLFVWICYLGVNLFGSGLHSYGWFSK